MILLCFQLNRILHLILKGLMSNLMLLSLLANLFFAIVYFFYDRVFEKHAAGFLSKTFG